MSLIYNERWFDRERRVYIHGIRACNVAEPPVQLGASDTITLMHTQTTDLVVLGALKCLSNMNNHIPVTVGLWVSV